MSCPRVPGAPGGPAGQCVVIADRMPPIKECINAAGKQYGTKMYNFLKEWREGPELLTKLLTVLRSIGPSLRTLTGQSLTMLDSRNGAGAGGGGGREGAEGV